MTQRPSATEILESLGVSEPCEIDVEAIAYNFGCTVKYRRLEGCVARIVGAADRAVISVDRDSGTGRKRFSIGHELGHWLADRGKAIFLCKKSDLRTPWARAVDPEARANAFAADLLMPEYLFCPIAEGRPITFKTVDELAKMFKVSRPAAAIRLVQLGSFPSMIVCHDLSGRRWFQGSPGVDGRLWPHNELGHETDAFEILHGGEGSGRSQIVDADDWINHPAAARYSLQEHSVAYGASVLSLLWWKDESMIEDLVSPSYSR